MKCIIAQQYYSLDHLLSTCEVGCKASGTGSCNFTRCFLYSTNCVVCVVGKYCLPCFGEYLGVPQYCEWSFSLCRQLCCEWTSAPQPPLLTDSFYYNIYRNVQETPHGHPATMCNYNCYSSDESESKKACQSQVNFIIFSVNVIIIIFLIIITLIPPPTIGVIPPPPPPPPPWAASPAWGHHCHGSELLENASTSV